MWSEYVATNVGRKILDVDPLFVRNALGVVIKCTVCSSVPEEFWEVL
jgi:hypothetical protein